MKLQYGPGCVDIEVEPEDVGKHYRVSDPGWNETMDAFEVEELWHEPDSPIWQAMNQPKDFVPPREPTRLEYTLADVVESGCNGITQLLTSAAMDWASIRWSAIQAQRQLREVCHG